MGRSRCRRDILIALASATLATACSGIDDSGPPPQWIPLDELTGLRQPEVVEASAAMVASQPTIRVVTYNTLFGVHAELVSEDFEATPDLAHVDVIALQESLREAGDDISDAGKLAARLGMGYVFVPLQEHSGDLEGVALLSRFPLHDVELMPLHDFTSNNLLDSAASRVALAATIDTTRGSIRIVNTHLQVVINMPERVLQVRPVVLDPTMPSVVLGDFNTNDYIWAAESIPLLPQDAAADTSQAKQLDGYMHGIGYQTPTASLGDTWHGFPEDQRLDSIFTFQLATGRGAVERGVGFSDHWPLWLDVALP